LRRTFRVGFRVIVAIAAYSFVAFKIGTVELSNIFTSLSETLLSNNLFWLGLVVVLMPLVWALEAFKWRYVLSKFTNISFWRSWRSVWYGVVAGQLTPNRIGEPIGRLALIEPNMRGKAGVAAVWCSFSQQLATIVFGLIGIIWWTKVKGFYILPPSIPLWIVFYSILCWLGLIILGIIKIQKIARWIEGFSWVRRSLHGESLILDFRTSAIVFVLIISILRYLVFSTQYVMLLRFFGVGANPIDLYAVVGLTYLFSSIIPSFSASEVGVKAGFAIWFAGMISDNALGVTAASLFLWMLNLAIPALIAAWFPWKGER